MFQFCTRFVCGALCGHRLAAVLQLRRGSSEIKSRPEIRGGFCALRSFGLVFARFLRRVLYGSRDGGFVIGRSFLRAVGVLLVGDGERGVSSAP